MKIKNWLSIALLILIYFIILLFAKRDIFTYRFDTRLIDRYFLSQDIPYEPKGRRLFLSDSEIYLATGFLYAKGADPTTYNFDHPPLIKYLFGFSLVLFKNPNLVQVLFGAILIFLTYYLGLKIFRSSSIAFFSSALLTIDPLFLDQSSQPLLDLGEAVFLLLYLISKLFFKKNFLLQGIFLGLLAGAKSLVGPLFFVLILVFYELYKKEFKARVFVLHLGAAFITFSLLYSQSFIERGGAFNIVFFMLKTVKYRIQHNTTSLPGASLLLFLTGFFQTWWGQRVFLREKIWTLFWPASFAVMSVKTYLILKTKRLNLKNLLALTPFLYLLYLGIQAPFARYFLIILPFAYLTLAEFILSNFARLISLKAKKKNVDDDPDK